MHIAYIHQHFSTRKGATGTRSYEMSQALLARGHRVSMICGVAETATGSVQAAARITEQEIDGIRVFAIAEPYSNKMSFLQRVKAFGAFARDAFKVLRDLRPKPDVVFATSTPLTVGLPGRKAARHHGVPFVFEVRDLWPDVPIAIGVIKNPLLIWYTRRMERGIYRAARHIIALSPGMKEGIVKTGYPAAQVTMIPNGCDLDLFAPSAQRLADPRFGAPDDFKLVFTGAHGLANGLDAVLDAAAELKRRGATGVKLVFIGTGGQKPQLVERSKREGLDDLIVWAEPVSKNELSRILPQMDAGLMILRNLPAFYYGTSPNKFFDYISAGLPVLNNYPGWIADMLAAHQCGMAVPPGDPRAFADAVLWMRDHRDECRAMGRRGRSLAEAEFGRPKLAAEFVRVIEGAAAGS